MKYLERRVTPGTSAGPGLCCLQPASTQHARTTAVQIDGESRLPTATGLVAA